MDLHVFPIPGEGVESSFKTWEHNLRGITFVLLCTHTIWRTWKVQKRAEAATWEFSEQHTEAGTRPARATLHSASCPSSGVGVFLSVTAGFAGLRWGSDHKESACNAGVSGSIPRSARPPGEGNGTPLRYSCLENPVDRGAWWATVLGGHKESDTNECLTHTQ